MAYIRTKKMGAVEYLYLVKSVWNRGEKTSRQKIIKYLGAASAVTINDIPHEYRGESNVQKFFAAHDTDATQRLQERLYHTMTCNDLDGALAVYEEAAMAGSVETFFDMVFRPVLYKIGRWWADGRIDITTEHVASNVANSLVRIVRDRLGARRGKVSVVICVPSTEKHHMGCDVLETYLASRGFVVYNLGNNTPTTEVLKFLERTGPDAVAISASGQYSIQPALNMADRISDAYGIPIILGGYAFREQIHHNTHTVCKDTPLNDIPRIIRQAVTSRNYLES